MSSSEDIEVLQTHKELVVKPSQEIHLAWKLIPPILYFICALTGYCSSIFFHIFWYDIYTGNCPLWAHIIQPPKEQIMQMINSPRQLHDSIPNTIHNDWRKNLLITFNLGYHCKFYHAICFCSCLFGIVWCIIFTRCTSVKYAAQYLIILPSLIFQIVFTIIIIIAIRNFEVGYTSFTNEFEAVAHTFMNETEISEFTSTCELINYYHQIHQVQTHHLCHVQTTHQTLSWIMTSTWIVGLIFLIVRIIAKNDFRLRKTIIYKIPVTRNSSAIREENIPETELKMNRLKQSSRVSGQHEDS